jgi:hypothetical protein
MNELLYCYTEYKNHFTYSVFTPNYQDEEYISGPGAEISFLKPYTDYIYHYDYPINGYDRLLKSKIFRNQTGKVVGQGVGEDGTAPLFNMNYSLPVIFRSYANKDYRALFTILICIVLSNTRNIYGTEAVPDLKMTEEMLSFLERTHVLWGGSMEQFHENGKISEEYDASEWIVKLEKSCTKNIEENIITQAKIEFKQKIFYKKYNKSVSLDDIQQLELDWPQ